MIGTLYIDDLDGAVTLFKSTEDGTETISVFDEEHREVIQDLVAEVKRLRRFNKNLTIEPRVTIDEWNTKPEGNADAEPLPCVTVYMNGCEYVGCLRLYKDEDGEMML